MYNKIFDKIVFSNTPPSNTNVIWIYPIDNKHYDIRMYTIVQQDEYTSIKKWTSIGITDIAKTELSTDFWYVGFLEKIPTFDLEEINNIPVQRHEEYNTTVEDMPIIDRLLVSYVFDDLDRKNLYFDTRQVDPEKDLNKYYTVVIPDYYKINSIIKENYYEEEKTYQKDVLAEGEYLISSTLDFNGKQYTLLTLKFYDELTPFQITTNVVRDLEIKDFIVQETGNSIDKVMSQQAVTKELDVLKDILFNVDVPNLATVAKTGDYNDLLNKPVIPSTEGLATIANVERSLIQSKLYTDQQISSIEFPEPVKKLSQLENDTNFAEGIHITTIHNDEWIDNPDTERWMYKSDYNILFLSIKPNERIFITDSPITLSGIYFMPSIETEAQSATYELVFKTSDSAFGIGTLEEIQWAKEPVFNANKTYAVSTELNKVNENTAVGLAMYAEFDTLNMEGYL